MKQNLLRFSVVFLFVTLSLQYACRETSSNGIPSYIKIEKISLSTSHGQGTASHKITDAWVYIGNDFIGAFELPATFPLLKTGLQEVTILPGIKINGIAATRAPYPFFNPLTVNVNLVAGGVTSINNLATTYKSKTVFAWMENFESGVLSIDTTINSQTSIRRINTASLIFNLPGEQNYFSATSNFWGNTKLFECASVQRYALPRNDVPVFFEMNYRTNNSITVGVFAHTSQQVSQKSVLVLNPTETWNKIYINLTPTIQMTPGAIGYKVFLGVLRDANVDTAKVYFDNLKLLYLN